MLRIRWVAQMSNEVLRKVEIKSHILRIRKRWLKFVRHILRKESLENLRLTGHINGKGAERNRE